MAFFCEWVRLVRRTLLCLTGGEVGRSGQRAGNGEESERAGWVHGTFTVLVLLCQLSRTVWDHHCIRSWQLQVALKCSRRTVQARLDEHLQWPLNKTLNNHLKAKDVSTLKLIKHMNTVMCKTIWTTLSDVIVGENRLWYNRPCLYENFGMEWLLILRN